MNADQGATAMVLDFRRLHVTGRFVIFCILEYVAHSQQGSLPTAQPTWPRAGHSWPGCCVAGITVPIGGPARPA
jgi:hypothetical protein